MGPRLIRELEIHVLLFVTYVRQVRQSTDKNHETYYYLQGLFHIMSNRLNELKKLYIQSNYTYVKHVKLYSCEDISDCESDSVFRELTLLSCIAINLSLTVAPLNFNFFLGRLLDLGFVHSGVAAGLLCFGVEVLLGVTSFLRSAFIASKAIVVLIDSNLIESISNVLSTNESTIVMSLNTSTTVLYTSSVIII